MWYKVNTISIKLTLAAGFICFSTCAAMSSAEATFRCKTSIENAENTYNKLDNSDLKRITKTAISLMKKIFEDLSHGTAFKDLPTMTHQCIQHAEHVTWLRDSIEPAIQTAKAESKVTTQKLPPPPEPESKKSKQPTKKKKREGKKVELNQRTFNPKAIEKMLDNEKDKKPSDSLKSSPPVSTPTL